MVFIKALLMIGLFGVSLSLANISGIVTDSASTPISGAVVWLEKGGQTTTTLNDGSFTFSTTDIISGNSKLPVNGFSEKVNGNIMTLMIPERSVVEIAMFDLSGKLHSNIRQEMETGFKNVAFSKCGAGLYLYKIKTGSSCFWLKNTSILSVKLSTIPSYKNISSSKSLAKQHAITAAINDVLRVSKSGYLISRIAITSTDTIGIKIKMLNQDVGTITDIDGNEYHTIRIGTQIWMQENWRSTKYNDGSPISMVLDSVAWYNRNLPGYCYFNNTTNSDSIKKFGALYNWYTLNTSLFAPPGWHIPTTEEWHQLEDYLIKNGYN